MSDFWQIFRFVIAALLTLAGVFCMISSVLGLYRTFVHVLPAESTTTVDPCGTCTSTRADFEPLLRRFTYVPCGWRTMP